MPRGAGEAALAARVHLPGLRARRPRVAGWARAAPVQPLQAPGLAHRRDDLPRHQLPLTTWFLAIHLVATAKNGISSIELGRRLGVKQSNAWAMKQKIMQVMLAREAAKPLQGRVELDDAYLGGERSGGKRGRGAAGKTRGGGRDHA